MNKNGWGLRKELGFILLFVFCLLVAMIGLNEFGLGLNEGTGYSYKTLENKLTGAALRYYEDKHYNSSDVVIVSLSTLKNNGYISNFVDENGITCEGYAKIVNSDVALPYVRCFSYKTSGYESEYE